MASFLFFLGLYATGDGSRCRIYALKIMLLNIMHYGVKLSVMLLTA